MGKQPAFETEKDLAVAVVLAAGKGSRLGPNVDKMTVSCAGKPLVRWVVDRMTSIHLVQKTIVVISKYTYQAQDALSQAPSCHFVKQTEFYGTAFAVLSAREMLRGFEGSVVIVDGDLALMRKRTLEALIRVQLDKAPSATLLAFRPTEDSRRANYGVIPWSKEGIPQPTGKVDDARVLCLAGAMCFRWDTLVGELHRLIREYRDEHRLSEIPARLLASDSGQHSVEVLFLNDLREAGSVNCAKELEECERLLLGDWE